MRQEFLGFFMQKNNYLSSMKYLLAIAFLCLSIAPAQAQKAEMTGDEQEVYNVVVKLFDGMRAGDSSLVHSVFSKDSRMYSNSEDKEGNLQTQEGSLDRFLTGVGTPHDQVWDEQIWNTEVRVEMGVAQVWTEYAFYLGETFSHCGIDAFQFIKNQEGEWKIVQLIDTRRKNDCDHKKE
jgi:hypothetical protein